MSNMLQIGVIASAQQTSGTDIYYFNLMRELRVQGVDLRGLVLGDPGVVPEAVPEIASFAREGLPARERWESMRRAVRARLADTDLVVSHMAAHVFQAIDLIGGRPLVEHFHGPWALEGKFGKVGLARYLLRQVQERVVYRRAQRIIVLSRSYGDILERKYGVSGEKIRVVPGGADLRRFDTSIPRSAARKALGIDADRPVVATVRRLESTKGVDRLIVAIAEVRRTVPDVLLVIAGTGALHANFERLVRDLKLESNVSFAGLLSQERVSLLYRAANVSVVPSVAFEGFGLVCIESLGCGTPVLVTPIGGLPEAVEALDPALVLAGTAASDIADGLRDALLGKVPLPSESACIAYARRFSWPEITRRVRDVYSEVV
ncbi:MAG: glycosyltransferase family 4 protein [Candidatus Velthaea sp.]